MDIPIQTPLFGPYIPKREVSAYRQNLLQNGNSISEGYGDVFLVLCINSTGGGEGEQKNGEISMQIYAESLSIFATLGP